MCFVSVPKNIISKRTTICVQQHHKFTHRKQNMMYYIHSPKPRSLELCKRDKRWWYQDL